jgi:hypothetical protein
MSDEAPLAQALVKTTSISMQSSNMSQAGSWRDRQPAFAMIGRSFPSVNECWSRNAPAPSRRFGCLEASRTCLYVPRAHHFADASDEIFDLLFG